jgi:hypothetical protein
MNRKLVTVATFDQPPQAQLAHNAISAAGIRAVVTDEAIVAMDWLLANAVGGIKVQVWEDDADRAVAVLEEAFGERGEKLGTIDPRQLATEAEAAGSESEEPTEEEFTHPVKPTPSTAEPNEESPPVPASERDQYARRAVFAGVTGILVPLVPFYAVYLLLNAMFGLGELSARGRYHLIVGSIATSLALSLEYLYFQMWAGR